MTLEHGIATRSIVIFLPPITSRHPKCDPPTTLCKPCVFRSTRAFNVGNSPPPDDTLDPVVSTLSISKNRYVGVCGMLHAPSTFSSAIWVVVQIVFTFLRRNACSLSGPRGDGAFRLGRRRSGSGDAAEHRRNAVRGRRPAICAKTSKTRARRPGHYFRRRLSYDFSSGVWWYSIFSPRQL